MVKVSEQQLNLGSISNGVFTLVSAKSGEHRTFRVSKEVVNDPADEPIQFVSLLSGPDNESDYRSFAILDSKGRVHPFRKLRGTQYEKMAVMLNRLNGLLAAAKVELHHENACMLCGRKLTTPTSVQTGIGPVCATKE